jgi:hypothetical protein
MEGETPNDGKIRKEEGDGKIPRHVLGMKREIQSQNQEKISGAGPENEEMIEINEMIFYCEEQWQTHILLLYQSKLSPLKYLQNAARQYSASFHSFQMNLQMNPSSISPAALSIDLRANYLVYLLFRQEYPSTTACLGTVPSHCADALHEKMEHKKQKGNDDEGYALELREYLSQEQIDSLIETFHRLQHQHHHHHLPHHHQQSMPLTMRARLLSLSALYSHLLHHHINHSTSKFYHLFVSKCLLMAEISPFILAQELEEYSLQHCFFTTASSSTDSSFNSSSSSSPLPSLSTLCEMFLHCLVNKWNSFYDFSNLESLSHHPPLATLPPLSTLPHSPTVLGEGVNELTTLETETETRSVSKSSLLLTLKADVCGICLIGEPTTCADVTILCCGSVYHMDCLLQWFRTQARGGFHHLGTCPTCRAVIKLSDTEGDEVIYQIPLGHRRGGTISSDSSIFSDDNDSDDNDNDSDSESDSDSDSEDSVNTSDSSRSNFSDESHTGFLPHPTDEPRGEEFRMGLNISALPPVPLEHEPLSTPTTTDPLSTQNPLSHLLRCSVCHAYFIPDSAMESCSNHCCVSCCSAQPLFCPSHYRDRIPVSVNEVLWNESSESINSSSQSESESEEGEEEDEGGLAMETNSS